MAGQAHRGGSRAARSSRVVSSSEPIAAAYAAASGSAIATTTAPSSVSTASAAELRTRATYRNLILRGLAPDEAANLTAYLAGIAVGETRWTMAEINQLLFLREMQRTGQFDEPLDPRLI